MPVIILPAISLNYIHLGLFSHQLLMIIIIILELNTTQYPELKVFRNKMSSTIRHIVALVDVAILVKV
jgi:hypothetical protein